MKLINYQQKKDDNDLDIKGLIKIYWNLKNPIKLSTKRLSETNQDQLNSNLLIDKQTNFKTTSIKDLNKKSNKKSAGMTRTQRLMKS